MSDRVLDKPVVIKPNIGERIYATIFSWLFHPLFVPLYVAAFLAYLHPSAFTGFSAEARERTLVIVALNLVFYPLFSVLLLKQLKFIDSIFLRTKKDRIIPYMACGIFFFWTYIVFKEQSHYPKLLTSFVLGIFLASSVGLIANIYYKISLHAIGMGGWLGFFIVTSLNDSMHMTWPLAAVILLTGLVSSARLLISDHTAKDIYTGIFVGLITQLIAAVVVL